MVLSVFFGYIWGRATPKDAFQRGEPRILHSGVSVLAQLGTIVGTSRSSITANATHKLSLLLLGTATIET